MVVDHSLTLHLGTDHAGLKEKDVIRDWLRSFGWSVVDHGTNQIDDQDDFPDFIAPASAAVSRAPLTNRAVIFGGSGQGEAMLANRFPGVRAVVCYYFNPEIIKLSRLHNDSNVLSFGARFMAVEEMKLALEIWLKTPVEADPKRARRNQKIEAWAKSRLL